MTETLRNGQVSFELTVQGGILRLADDSLHHNYASGSACWRLYFEDGIRTQCEIRPEDCAGELTREGDDDPTFRNMLHRWTIADGAFGAGFSTHLFLKPGESLELGEYVLSPHTGDWHVGADKYRAWVETWMRPAPKPDWLRHFNGWQRLIFRQQNGEILFRYTDLPTILEEGLKAGDRLGIVAAQSHLDETATVFHVPGYRFERHDAAGGAGVEDLGGGRVRARLPRHALLLLRFIRAQETLS